MKMQEPLKEMLPDRKKPENDKIATKMYPVRKPEISKSDRMIIECEGEEEKDFGELAKVHRSKFPASPGTYNYEEAEEKLQRQIDEIKIDIPDFNNEDPLINIQYNDDDDDDFRSIRSPQEIYRKTSDDYKNEITFPRS